jgi:hypothetical protein
MPILKNVTGSGKKFLIAGAIFVVILIVIFSYARYTATKKNNHLSEQLSSIKQSERDLDFASAQKETLLLIESYRHSGEKEKELGAMSRLAFDYDRAGDFKKGVPLFKQVILDPQTSPQIKAESIARLTNTYYRGGWKELAQEIFNDSRAPFATALGTGSLTDSHDLSRAINSLNEIANKTYPLSYLYYTDASWYAARITALDSDAFKRVQSDIATGDALSAKEATMSDFIPGSFSFDFYSAGNLARFNAMTLMAQQDGQLAATVAKDYAELMDTFARYPDHHALQSIEKYVRFYYAAFLANFYGETEKTDITDILRPTFSSVDGLDKINGYSIWPFYERELSKPEGEQGANAKSILKLASVVPEFNDFLVSKGWKK